MTENETTPNDTQTYTEEEIRALIHQTRSFTEEEIRALIHQGEGETLEFISKVNTQHITETIAAFANTKGGMIVIGVRNSGEIIGIPAVLNWTSLIRDIRLLIPEIESLIRFFGHKTVDEKAVAIIVIKTFPRDILLKGLLYRRSSDGNYAVDPHGAIATADSFSVQGDLPVSAVHTIASGASNLSDELTTLRRQLAIMEELTTKMQQEQPTDEQLTQLLQEQLLDEQFTQRLQELVTTADRAAVQADRLTAQLHLPPRKLTDQRLVPAHSLERLEEYQADQNWIFLLVGAFAGALLGIPVNWATSETFSLNVFTGVFIGMLLLLLVGSIAWLFRIRNRATAVKESMLNYPIGSEE